MTALRSMTGWGEGEATADGVTVKVTMRAVNHKQLDVRVALPSAHGALEAELVRVIRRRAHRGRVEVRVSVDTVSATAGVPAAEVLSDTVAALDAIATTYELARPTLADVLRFAGGDADAEPISTKIVAPVAREALGVALDAFEGFRAREGAELATFFAESLAALAETLQAIDTHSAEASSAHRARLTERANALLEGALDPERLEQEVVLIAERSDIAEETQRAGAHREALLAAVAGDGPHGKRLDFLLQELIRETNTMASKATSVALTHAVVEAKTLIERMREQAHNVE